MSMGSDCGPHQLQGALDALIVERGVRGALVADNDGLPVALRLRTGMDAEGLAALAATLGRLAERVTAELGRGDLDLLALDTDLGLLLVKPLSFGFLLALGEADANLALIAASMADAAGPLQSAANAASRGVAARGGHSNVRDS